MVENSVALASFPTEADSQNRMISCASLKNRGTNDLKTRFNGNKMTLQFSERTGSLQTNLHFEPVLYFGQLESIRAEPELGQLELGQQRRDCASNTVVRMLLPQ